MNLSLAAIQSEEFLKSNFLTASAEAKKVWRDNKNAESAKQRHWPFVFSAFFAVECLLLLLLFPITAKAAVSFSPGFGQPGNLITVTGTGFSTAATTNVFFNHLTLADFDIVNSTTLTVVVPPGAQSGFISVNAANNSTSNFLVAPRIDSFTPETQNITNLISISGANFILIGTNTLVTFPGTNGSIVTTGTVTSVSQISVKVPPGATNGPLKVTTSAGSGLSTDSFIASNRPLITDFSPTLATNGSTLLINGANFIAGTLVKFGTVTATPTISSLTQLHVVIPSTATNNPITVSNANGTFTTSSNLLTGKQPTITDFTPIYGGAGVGLTIDGYNFLTESAVKINGAAISQTNITGKSDTQLSIILPSGLTTGPITVVNPTGSFTTTSNFLASGPIISDFSPTLAGPGTNVVINGANFTSGTLVLKFNTNTATFTPTSDTQINAKVPAGATTGPLVATIGTTSFTTSSNFTVIGNAPAITDCSPTAGVRGTLVTIHGKNFINPTAVSFNGTNAIFLTPTDTGTIQAYVPGNATSGPLRVTSAAGTGTNTFNFYIQPRIDTFTPTNGIVGATFTINGRNFTNALAVTVGGISYPFSDMATQLVVTVPSNAFTGTLVVTTPEGPIISPSNFTILPKIYSFSPTIGQTNTVVTIDGTSLFNVTSVKFGNGASAVPFVVGTNEIQVVVPFGAATGPLQITTPSGTDTSTNTFTFTTPSELVLTQTIAPPTVPLGQTVIYTLFLTNEGPSINTGVFITNGVPGGLTFVSASSTMGTCTFSNGVVTNTIGVMTNNTSATLTIVATAYFQGAFTNTAYARANEPDLNIDNNFTSGIVFIVSSDQRSLTVTKQANQKMVLSWPDSSVNFILQSSTNLSSPTNWVTVSPGPNTNGAVNYYTNDLSLKYKFFRLINQ